MIRFPHKVTPPHDGNYKHIGACAHWCYNIGELNTDWSYSFEQSVYSFYFNHEADAITFKLIFGSENTKLDSGMNE